MIAKQMRGVILIMVGLISACAPKSAQVRPDVVTSKPMLEGIEVGSVNGKYAITIKSSENISGNYTALQSGEKRKINITIKDTELGNFAGPIIVNDGTVSTINAVAKNGMGIEVEIGFETPVTYEASALGNVLDLYVTPSAMIVADTGMEQAKLEGGPKGVEESSKPMTEVKNDEKAASGEQENADKKKALKIVDVVIRRSGDRAVTEIYADGDIDSYNVFALKSPNRLVVDIPNARELGTPKQIKPSSADIVKAARLGRYDNKVRVVLDLVGDMRPYDVQKGNKSLFVSIGKKNGTKNDPTDLVKEEKKGVVIASSKEMPDQTSIDRPDDITSKPEKIEMPDVKSEISGATAAQKEEVITEKEDKDKSAAIQESEKAKEGKGHLELPAEDASSIIGEKKYTGQKVTLEFKDADIKNIFRIIAEVSGYNMIIDPAVAGKLTLRLVNVPWDQALDIILETNNLGMSKIGNVIRVMPAAAMKKGEEEKLKAKKDLEKLEEQYTKLIPISYAKASDISGRIKSIMSDYGKIETDDRTNTIILKDIQRVINDAMALVAQLDSPTKQVLIEARVVSANSSIVRDLGIEWGLSYIGDGAHGTSTGNYFPNNYTIRAGGGGGWSQNPPGSGVGPQGGNIGINFGSINKALNLDLVLSSYETEALLKVVSSPKVVTLDNKEATISQGYSLPYTTASSSGTETKFVDASLSLTVLPHITPDGRVQMKVKASKNRPGEVGPSGQSIEKNEASTEVLVKDGDTIVLGGIYEITKDEVEQGMPWLRNIPIIGWLFKHQRKAEDKRELLIFITPRIVQEISVS